MKTGTTLLFTLAASAAQAATGGIPDSDTFYLFLLLVLIIILCLGTKPTIHFLYARFKSAKPRVKAFFAAFMRPKDDSSWKEITSWR